jgi:hypothetical protein
MVKGQRIEVYVWLLLAIITATVRMRWWQTSLLVLIVAGISLHLVTTFPTKGAVKTKLKAVIGLAAIAVIGFTFWRAKERGDSITAPATTSESVSIPAPATTAVDQSQRVAAPVSGSVDANTKLKLDTANLVKQLLDFQQKINDWNSTAASRMNENLKTEKDNAGSKSSIERAKELTASMANLDRQFKQELKPKVIALRKQLLSKLPTASVPAKPTVDYTLQYGFTTFPNAVGDIADYLQDLAGRLPEK